MNYQQISCRLFDQIESLAVTRKEVIIKFYGEDAKEKKTDGFIENILSENKAEYLLINGFKVRLDKIISLNEK